MGRLFLVAIVVGLCWGGYKVYQNISGLTDGEALSSRYHPSKEDPPEGDITRQDPPEPARMRLESPESTVERVEKPDPLPVQATVQAQGDSFIMVESWGVVRAGEELPDGSVLRSWSSRDALVTNPEGQLERRRFRRVSEALALLSPVMASALDGPSVAPSWPQGQKSQSSERP